MLEKIWRYTINGFGGIVFAETKDEAEEKVTRMYKEEFFIDGELCVWNIKDDDYFNSNCPDVWECYGI